MPNDKQKKNQQKKFTFLDMVMQGSAMPSSTAVNVPYVPQTQLNPVQRAMLQAQNNQGEIKAINKMPAATPESRTLTGLRANRQTNEDALNVFDIITDPYGNATEQIGLGRLGSLVPNNLLGTIAKVGMASVMAREAAKRIVGRYATNMIEPYSYTNKLPELRYTPFKQQLKAFVKDEPLYDASGNRELPYRMMFGLKPRIGGANGALAETYSRIPGAKFDFNSTDAPVFAYNPSKPTFDNLNFTELLDDVEKKSTNNLLLQYNHGYLKRIDPVALRQLRAVDDARKGKNISSKNLGLFAEDVMGHYGISPKNNMVYDLWDVGHNKGEYGLKNAYKDYKNKDYDNLITHALRYTVGNLTDPVMLVNKFK